MLTTGGTLVPFSVVADDDHRDLVVVAKGKSAFASLQAKACFELGASGFVQSNATYFPNSIPSQPSWIYVVVLVLELAPVVWWLVPAPAGQTSLADEVALGRFDLDAARLEILDAPIQLVGFAGDLEEHPALVLGNVGAPDIGDELELLPELVDHRLLDHVRAKDQLETPPRHTGEV